MNSFFFTLFIISLALLFLSCLNPIEAAKCNPDDEAGHLAFKSCITQDPSGLLSSWKKGTSCCSWNGVTCSNSDRVTGLLLIKDPQIFPGGSISGTYSPLLAKLQHLEVISLANQENMTGTFPRFLLHLPKLRHISFMNNGLSGSLPDNIGVLSQLESLVLEGNRFTGSIPVSISNLTRLSVLFMSNNLLTGTIPLEVANLKLLINLNLGNNRLTGNIPNIFKNMKNLQSLDLSQNRFSGKLPSSLPSTLDYILLNQNNLSGTIPSYLSRFTGLEELDLSKNRFSGVVPKGFVNLRFIKKLIFSHNLLTDPLPVLSVNNIQVLDLSYNNFHLNKIPKWITLLPGLQSLNLAKCGIKMSLTDWKPFAPTYYSSIDLSESCFTV